MAPYLSKLTSKPTRIRSQDETLMLQALAQRQGLQSESLTLGDGQSELRRVSRPHGHYERALIFIEQAIESSGRRGTPTTKPYLWRMSGPLLLLTSWPTDPTLPLCGRGPETSPLDG